MTKEGIKKCIALLTVMYPNTYKDFRAEQYDALVQGWGIQFNQCEDLDVWVALNKVISVSSFPPSIAEIKAQMVDDDDLSAEEVWEIIAKAGKNGLYGAEEEYQKLPERIRKIIRPGTLKEIAMADSESLHFIKKDILAEYKASGKKEAEAQKIQLGDKRLLQIEQKGEDNG